MIRLFKHYIPYPVLVLGLIDFLLLMMAAEAGWIFRAVQINMGIGSIADRPAPIFSFAIALQLALIAVGIYGPEALQSLRFAAARILVAISLGVIFLSLMSFAMPGVTLWRSNSLYAMVLAILFLMVVRILLGTILDSDIFKRRLLILGAGPRAGRIAAMEKRQENGFTIAGYVDMNEGPSLIESAVKRQDIANLPQHVIDLAVSEDDQDDRCPCQRAVQLSGTRNRAGRPRQREPELVHFLRRLFFGPQAVHPVQAGL